MCIKKVEAWGFNDKIFATEIEAIAAALHGPAHCIKRDGVSDALKGLLANAEATAPLLSRYVELLKEQEAALSEKDPDPRLSDLALTEQGHTSSCRARATGDELDCNCGASDD